MQLPDVIGAERYFQVFEDLCGFLVSFFYLAGQG